MIDKLMANLKSLVQSNTYRIYEKSIHPINSGTLFIARDGLEKKAYLYLNTSKVPDFPELEILARDRNSRFYAIPKTWDNTRYIQDLLPYTKPTVLRNRGLSFGTGDRLGITTPFHAEVFRDREDIFPVFAQQSVRELSLSARDFKQVLSCAVFGIIESGYKRNWGADGDHLKCFEDVRTAMEAGMTMFTLDLSEFLSQKAANDSFIAKAEHSVRSRYEGKSYSIGGTAINFTGETIDRCFSLYGKALDYCFEVFSFLKEKCRSEFALEISIDETDIPTHPEDHLFFVLELKRRKIDFCSLAPRFIGEFQKGIDYIGDVEAFREHLRIHEDICETLGGYKLSIHSGSDKFSVFPTINEITKGNFHVKTSGTTWLEAVRVIAAQDCELYRSIHRVALDFFNEAKLYYHLRAELENISLVEKCTDDNLSDYLSSDDSRQMLHVSYGELLKNKELIERIYLCLLQNEEIYKSYITKHFRKHVEYMTMK